MEMIKALHYVKNCIYIWHANWTKTWNPWVAHSATACEACSIISFTQVEGGCDNVMLASSSLKACMTKAVLPYFGIRNNDYCAARELFKIAQELPVVIFH